MTPSKYFLSTSPLRSSPAKSSGRTVQVSPRGILRPPIKPNHDINEGSPNSSFYLPLTFTNGQPQSSSTRTAVSLSVSRPAENYSLNSEVVQYRWIGFDMHHLYRMKRYIR